MIQIRKRDLLFTAAAAAALPGLGWAQGGQQAEDPHVDPELRAIFRGRPTQAPATLEAFTQPARRSTQAKFLPAPAPQPVERKIPGPAGAPDVRVLIVRPEGASGPRPALLYIHGGGYVMGRADGSVTTLQELARDHGIVGISVDYRLAPETRYPGSLEDNYAALKWLHGHAAELGVDPARIAVGGASAGGGHAAALAIAARDRKQVPVKFQLLIYPMLDDRTASTRPASPFAGKYVWTPEANRIGWTALLGHKPGGAHEPATAAPARLTDFRGLPPAFIGVGDIDLFCLEDVAYARKLIEAGIPTDLMVVPGAFHAFDGIAPNSGVAKSFKAEWTRVLVQNLVA